MPGKNSPAAGKLPGLCGRSAPEIKAHFVARGTSLNRFAQAQGVSHALVSKLIHRQRPGRTGRSRAVMSALARELANGRAL